MCINCNGVWLDHGELQELKEKSKTNFKGDEMEKAVERWEESVRNSKGSFFKRLFRG